MTPTDADKRLVNKAQASKTPWPGVAGVTFKDGWLRRKIKLHGVVASHDLNAAHDALMGCLGMDERIDFDLECDELDKATLDSAFEVFGNDKLDVVQIRGNSECPVDISGMAKCLSVNTIVLRDCLIEKTSLLSGCKRLNRFQATNCALGDLGFLSGCAVLNEVKLESCSFTGLDNLWAAAESLGELAVPDSKDLVDLSILRKLQGLCSLDIGGCAVTNFTSIRGHPMLRELKLEHNKGGIESLTFLLECPKLRTVKYSKSDFHPSVYLEYARVSRKIEYGNYSEHMLREAVKDRDVYEVRRLCDQGVCSDEALSHFKFESEFDLEIARMLAEHATEKRLGHLLGQVAKRASSSVSSKESPVATTNMASFAVELLDLGANPDEAVDAMIPVMEVDLGLFEKLVAKSSKKVLTKLLQKNINSFGNRISRGRAKGWASRMTMVEILLKHGADPNEREFFGNTSLGNAVVSDGSMPLVNLLLKYGANAAMLRPKIDLIRDVYSDKNGLWGEKRLEIVKILVTHGYDVNEKGKFGLTPLGAVVSDCDGYDDRDLELVAFLLDRGADPNMSQGTNPVTPVAMACRKHTSTRLLDLLISHGGKVPEDLKKQVEERMSSSGKAASHSKPRVPPTRNVASRTPVGSEKEVCDLHREFGGGAFRFGDGPQRLQQAIEDGANLNALDQHGNVPLVSLITGIWTGTNLYDLAKIMVASGAKVNDVGDWGITPLTAAVEQLGSGKNNVSTNLIMLLLENGANPLARGRLRPQCALEAAISHSDAVNMISVIRVLMRSCPPDAKIPRGVLTIAARVAASGHDAEIQAILRELVDRGAIVTDAAICAGWWNADLRKYLLEKEKKAESDFAVAECGSTRLVRAIPQVNADDSKERQKSERSIEMAEFSLLHERDFHHDGLLEMSIRSGRSELMSCVEQSNRRRARMLSRIPDAERAAVQASFAARAAEESNRVEKVFAQLASVTNGATSSGSLQKMVQERKQAWAIVESTFVKRSVPEWKVRELRLQYDSEIANFERMERNRLECERRQECDKSVSDCRQWMRQRLGEDESLALNTRRMAPRDNDAGRRAAIIEGDIMTRHRERRMRRHKMNNDAE